MSPEEFQSIAEKVARRTARALPQNPRCHTYTSGNYTVALVVSDDLTDVLVGVAKRNPADKPNPEIGERLAAARALRAPLGNARPSWEKWNQLHPIDEEENLLETFYSKLSTGGLS